MTRRCFTCRVEEHDVLEFGVVGKDESNVQQQIMKKTYATKQI
jgi:hypothetical protein